MKIYRVRDDIRPFLFGYISGMMLALSIFKMIGIINISWAVVFLGPLVFIGCVSVSIIIVMTMFFLLGYGNKQ